MAEKRLKKKRKGKIAWKLVAAMEANTIPLKLQDGPIYNINETYTNINGVTNLEHVIQQIT